MSYTYGESVLQIKNLNKSFGSKVVLRDININIKDVKRETTTGQVITLLGVSGCGKSTLMEIIAGLQQPTSGEILIGVKSEKPEAGKIGMVLQKYPLFEHRTVIGNLKLVSKDTDKIDFLLDNFDVVDIKNKYPVQISGGQRQRIAIIQQILSSDNFILLDEPFSGLDPVATNKLVLSIRKLANLNDENTIIISSHILRAPLAVSDTVIMLGKEKDIEGATITNYYDLVSMGLAWEENIKKNPKFIELCNIIEDKYIK